MDLASVSVVASQPITEPTDDALVLVTISPPEGTARAPADIVCIIDVSWSMSMEAKVVSGAGAVESNGLSMLDIAKHAVKTIIRILKPQDRIAIVDFCKIAKVLVPLTEMNEEGRRRTEAQLERLEFGSGTDLWKGLCAGLESLRIGAQRGRMGHIMLLTDGETEESASVMQNLQKYHATNRGLPGTVSAFGFGYEIDSSLLVEIANFCEGAYAFIPDAGLVGTCFVNSVSNLLVTMGKHTTLTLKAVAGAKILEVVGGQSKGATTECTLHLGNLQFGQNKDIVLRMEIKTHSAAYLHVAAHFDALTSQHSLEQDGIPPGIDKGLELTEPHRCRCVAVDTLRAVMQAARPGTEMALKSAQKILTDFVDRLKASPAIQNEAVNGLLQDLQGQCAEAISTLDYWKKWGRHYLPSVASAHALQQCNNFKDPGVQVYGGELFQDIRDEADAAFNSLPAPSITPAQYRYMGSNKIVRNPAFWGGSSPGASPARSSWLASMATQAQSAPADMSSYNDRFGG